MSQSPIRATMSKQSCRESVVRRFGHFIFSVHRSHEDYCIKHTVYASYVYAFYYSSRFITVCLHLRTPPSSSCSLSEWVDWEREGYQTPTLPGNEFSTIGMRMFNEYNFLMCDISRLLVLDKWKISIETTFALKSWSINSVVLLMLDRL